MQTRRLSIEDFLIESASMPVLDVRSPAEYAEGHMPFAISFPLFSDEERAVVGSLYQKEGKKPAMKKAIEIIGPMMIRFIENAEALHSSKFALYCWRGGMRSGSMAWLLEQYGFQTTLLEGGYKAYRNCLVGFFDKKLPLRIITGYTGSGKTLLLKAIRNLGGQVVDLEALANHSGSSFGNVLSSGQPTTGQFQNLIFEAFRKMDLQKPIWIEDEGLRIGKVWLPEGLFKQIGKSPHIFIGVSKEQRLDYLAEEYGHLSVDKLAAAATAISKRLGGDRTTQALKYINEGKLKEAAEIILVYYDGMYCKSISEKQELIVSRQHTDIKQMEAMAQKLINNAM